MCVAESVFGFKNKPYFNNFLKKQFSQNIYATIFKKILMMKIYFLNILNFPNKVHKIALRPTIAFSEEPNVNTCRLSQCGIK